MGTPVAIDAGHNPQGPVGCDGRILSVAAGELDKDVYLLFRAVQYVGGIEDGVMPVGSGALVEIAKIGRLEFAAVVPDGNAGAGDSHVGQVQNVVESRVVARVQRRHETFDGGNCAGRAFRPLVFAHIRVFPGWIAVGFPSDGRVSCGQKSSEPHQRRSPVNLGFNITIALYNLKDDKYK